MPAWRSWGFTQQDGGNELDEYVTEKKISWKNIVDRQGAMAEAYNVTSYPTLFLVDRQGILRIAWAEQFMLEQPIETLLQEAETP